MKRISFAGLAVPLIFAMTILGCGKADNQFGRSIDITKICEDSSCSALAADPEVSLNSGESLTVYLEIYNKMEPADQSPGQTVNVRYAEINYVTNSGELPNLLDHPPGSVEPGQKLIVPVKIFDFQQINYIRSHMNSFPDLVTSGRQQVTCSITLFFYTSGGTRLDKEEVLSIYVTP